MRADSLHPWVISVLSDLAITINLSPVACYWGAGQGTPRGKDSL